MVISEILKEVITDVTLLERLWLYLTVLLMLKLNLIEPILLRRAVPWVLLDLPHRSNPLVKLRLLRTVLPRVHDKVLVPELGSRGRSCCKYSGRGETTFPSHDQSSNGSFVNVSPL